MLIPDTHTLHQDEPANFPLVDVPDIEVRKHYFTHGDIAEDDEAR